MINLKPKKIKEIKKAISKHAKVYSLLEKLQQEKDSPIPIGDQKTSSIGEFYDCIYLHHKYPEASIEFGGNSQIDWDIQVFRGESPIKIQVKTISAHSKTRVMSPIYHGWDELHIISLDKLFQPNGFWVIKDTNLCPKGARLKGRKCPDPKSELGDKMLYRIKNKMHSAENLIAELQEAIRNQ